MCGWKNTAGEPPVQIIQKADLHSVYRRKIDKWRNFWLFADIPPKKMTVLYYFYTEKQSYLEFSRDFYETLQIIPLEHKAFGLSHHPIAICKKNHFFIKKKLKNVRLWCTIGKDRYQKG